MKRILAVCVSVAVSLSSVSLNARTTTYTYTPEGLIESLDGPRIDVVDVTSYTYDISGNRATMRNALGHVTQYTDYDGAGRLLRMVDPNGLVTSFTYHPRGWLLSQTFGEGAGAATTQYDYDPAGNITRITSPDGAYLDFTYDAANRLDSIADSDGNRVDYTLDTMGNRVAEETKNPQGAVTATLSRVYNTLNRLQRIAGAATDRYTDYVYDPNGNVTGVTDGLNRTHLSDHDALDRLISQLDPDSGETRFAYDARDNLTSVTDPRGNTTAYGYNTFDERTSQVSPDTGLTTYTYDEAGNLIRMTDARNVTVDYGYDALNRLTTVDYPGTDLDVTFAYDQGTHGIGRLTQMTDAAGSTAYVYNQRGNLIQEMRTTGALTLVTAYAYDNADRLITLSYPSGRKVHYGYDAQGQVQSATLERVDHNTQVLADNVTRLPFGPISGMQYGNGLSLTRSYDLDYRLVSQQIPGLLDDSYIINAVDNIKVWHDGLDAGRDQSFDYDALDRLITAEGPYGALGYTYDANGNRLSITRGQHTETYLIDLNSNRLTEIQGGLGDLFVYDASGNITASAKGGFGYDDSGRMRTYTAPGIAAAYAYNGLGERVSKTVNGTATYFVYADTQLLGEYDDSGNVIREYAYLDGQAVAVLVGGTADGPSGPPASDSSIYMIAYLLPFILDDTAAATGGNTGGMPPPMVDGGTAGGSGELYYAHTDHLGAIGRLSDDSGALVWDAERLPFGELNVLTASVEIPLRFPGQYYDEESGLHYNYFRDYDPSTGRYIQSDPIGLEGGLNTYAYVGGNPLTRIDPTGEFFIALPAVPPALAALGKATAFLGSAAAAAWGAANVWGDGTSDHPSHADEDDALATPLSASCEELEWAISVLEAAINWRKQDIRRHGGNDAFAPGHRNRIKILQNKLDKLKREYNLRCRNQCDS